MNYIVSRHLGAVAWLRSHHIEGEVLSHLTPEQVNSMHGGDAVYGILPLPLIAAVKERGARFFLLSLPQLPPEQRGKELTPAEMDSAGAKIFEVKNLEIKEATLGELKETVEGIKK